ncbi:hypothetical protein QR680_017607 [Steinernema hermaphroditum]|uniref:Glycerol kinase 5 n=1 Tax=Steinernema hermaphroditum TaxID=289476 RepID=A0AA39LNY4_9BILA|nr:hypothetical protein QR680_017607 [Steinernema hermaphroditum]
MKEPRGGEKKINTWVHSRRNLREAENAGRTDEVKLHYSGASEEVLRVEIDPDELWNQFLGVVNDVLVYIDKSVDTVTMGICAQRNTFITWNRLTMEPCHRMITWKDCRAKAACKEWNESFTLKALNMSGAVLHFFTRMPRFKAARMYKFINQMITHRLLVTIDENPSMKTLVDKGLLALGCIDTWLISKLTNGRIFITEPSSASSTGVYDPFQQRWGDVILKIVHFPVNVLPDLTTTAGDTIAVADNSIFGLPIHVGAMLGDQQAALFGSGCRRKGDVKISLGTGSFLDVVTGDKPHASMSGIYPLVGWSTPQNICFVAEGCSSDTSTILEWAHSLGLFDSVQETSAIAQTAPADAMVFFIPAFGGIQTPVNDDHACCAFMGLRPDTTKAVMIRAILESIAFRIYQIWTKFNEELPNTIKPSIRCCGGVSKNNFLCQTISSLLDLPVERVEEESFCAAKGAALLAGLSTGMWKMEKIDDLIMPVPQGYGVVGGGQQGPSCFQKLKMGFMMGAMIGGATGVLLGGFSAFRMGLRGREMLVQVGKVAAQSGGSFGVFMTVAQGIRC